jgi:hypothetical protein
MAYLDDINASYAQHERQANAALAAGNPAEAHAAHQVMQQLVADRDAYVSSLQSGGGGGSTTTVVDPYAYEKQLAAEAKRVREINAIETLRGVMTEYGLESLMGKIESYVKEGYEGDAVLALIRTTPEYNERFPAMKALQAKNRKISEAAYIEFERNAAQLERAYGLPSGMLGKETVTNLLSNEVSASELEERVTMAAAGAFSAPAEVRSTFEQYYGIGSGGLTAYFLDPDKALPLLTKQYAASTIGAEAEMQNFGIDVLMAERLTEAGITQEQARQGFATTARRRGFTQGRGDIVTEAQLVEGTLLGQEEAQKAIERVQKGRIGQFQQGGGYTATQQGVSGLGSAATR